MAVPKGFLVVPVGFRSDGTLRALELTDDDELKVYVASTVLDDILTALEKIDDLQNALDSVGTDELDVNVEESVLPTGAATETTLATLSTEAKLELVRLLLVSIDGKDFATQTTLASLLTELQAKADLSETQPISAAALPLPTGASTSAAQATALTELQAKLETADLEIVTSIPSVGPHGWIDGAWQRNPLLFGYSGVLYKTTANTSLSLGENSVDTSACASYEFWVITNISVMYRGTSPDYMEVRIVFNSTNMKLYQIANPTSELFYDKQGWWVLGPSDYLRVYTDDATANDDMYIFVTGFRVSSNQ